MSTVQTLKFSAKWFCRCTATIQKWQSLSDRHHITITSISKFTQVLFFRRFQLSRSVASPQWDWNNLLDHRARMNGPIRSASTWELTETSAIFSHWHMQVRAIAKRGRYEFPPFFPQYHHSPAIKYYKYILLDTKSNPNNYVEVYQKSK